MNQQTCHHNNPVRRCRLCELEAEMNRLASERDELLAALQAIAAMTDEDTGTFRKRGGTYRGLVGEIARAALARTTKP